jgi:energy-coupling factor transport system substrate-specific component
MNCKNRIVVFSSLGIVINIVLGVASGMLHIPLLFLDTVGTIFVAAICGPFYGALTGGLTNVVLGVIENPRNVPFALVNIVIGIIVGLVAKKWEFNLRTAVFTGVILAIVAPLIGTPIAVYVYGGYTGDFNDVIFAWLVKTGQKIFTAAFIPRIASNLVDKIISCIIVSMLIKRIPGKYLS